MRHFGTDYRLDGLSTQEIAGELDEFVNRVSRAIKHKRRKLSRGPLLNALVLWFLELDDARRVEMTKTMVARLEEFMSGDNEGETGHRIPKTNSNGSSGTAGTPNAAKPAKGHKRAAN